YKRREKGKLVNSYSSKDLEGILVKRTEEPSPVVCDTADTMEIEIISEDQQSSVKEQKIEEPYADWWGFKSGDRCLKAVKCLQDRATAGIQGLDVAGEVAVQFVLMAAMLSQKLRKVSLKSRSLKMLHCEFRKDRATKKFSEVKVRVQEIEEA
ncbi:unnamed protein product, partial [Thlaspi arvense]